MKPQDGLMKGLQLQVQYAEDQLTKKIGVEAMIELERYVDALIALRLENLRSEMNGAINRVCADHNLV